ncbi:hypothetical protein [Vreelandella populi]|uniref:DUF3168 domain-containing protein n=1 Tax=Vreelandella populi TaxID=2498858 RepID=A0A3S0YLC7_9GAMM|nr:hypothetical protein [Halomonas populi]RUR48794.1 hypothetical protein ELY37_02790 [Halomonas populi]
MSALDLLNNHLAGLPALDGVQRIFYRWYDEDVAQGAPPFLLLRPDGGGIENELMQQPDVRLAVCFDYPHECDAAINAIKDFLIQNHTAPGVCNFEILASPTGPFLLNNERNISQMTVRVWT